MKEMNDMTLPLNAVIKVRTGIHAGFALCEHLCAFGYALSEFRWRVAETLLFWGSVGLVAGASAVAVDLIIHHCKVLKVRREHRAQMST
jgi:hypothetical protein